MSKYKFGIMHLPIKTYLKWWLDKYAEGKEKIIVGISETNPAYLTNCLKRPLLKFILKGKTEQGENPSPDNPQEIRNVEGKNKANIKVIPNSSVITVENDTITLANNTSTIGYIRSNKTLSQICPNLKVGDEVKLSYKTTSNASSANMIYIRDASENWNNGASKIITQELLNGEPAFYGGYNETAVISEFMISKEGGAYVPYNCIQIKKCNKNLFDESILNQYKFSEDDEAYIFNNSSLYNKNLTPNIKFKENTAYFMTYIAKQTTGNPRLIFKYTDGSVQYIPSPIIPTTYAECQASSNPNKTLDYITSDYGSSGYNSFYIKKNSLMLEEGSTATEYVPHAEKTYNFPLSEGQVLMQDGTIEDKVVNLKNAIVLDGVTAGRKVDSITLHSGTGLYYCAFTIDNNDRGVPGADGLLSTHFKGAVGIALNNIYIAGVGTSFVFVLTDQTITTVEQANTWLAQQLANGTPVKIEYKSTTPNETDFTPEQQSVIDEIIKDGTYDEVTNIEATANINPDLYIEYYKSKEDE